MERKKKERMRLKRQNRLPSGETDICPSNGRVDNIVRVHFSKTGFRNALAPGL
ncbi:hypothetical protein AALB47_21815 [Lachnospiraceae bacterium 54-11]